MSISQQEFLQGGGFKKVSSDDFLGGGGFKIVDEQPPQKRIGFMQTQLPEEKPSFFQRVRGEQTKAAEDIIGGVQRGAEIISGGVEKIKEAPSIFGKLRGGVEVVGGAGLSALRTVGGVAGATFAPITEAPGVKQTLDFVADQIIKIPGVTDIVENAVELADKYPEQAKNIKNIVDIAVLVGGARTKTPADEAAGKGVQRIGKGLEKSGTKTFIGKQKEFVRNLLRPAQTKKVKELQVPRTTETGRGLFKRSIIAPTKAELKAEQVVLKIKGVSSSKTVQQNFNVISAANKQKAVALVDDIAKNNFKVAKDEILKTMDDIAVKVKQSPLITGDTEKTATKLWEGMRKFLNQNEKTGSGILKARKQYDKWVKGQKPAVFSDKVNAFEVANREIRNGINNLLEVKAPTLGIKQSLAEQSSLFTAMNNLVPKAAIEADTAIGRTMQKIGATLGTKNKLVQFVAAAAGIGGLGAAATFAPTVALAGIPTFLIWKAGKYILKPQVRVAIGKLLQHSPVTIDTVSKAFLIDILSDFAEDRED